MVRWIWRATKRRQRVRKQGPLITSVAVAPSGLDYPRWLTQGSQSLALGLSLNAATQLVESSRPGSSSDQAGTTVR
jgi:hypothetical protein